jgi:hypothetical protein
VERAIAHTEQHGYLVAADGEIEDAVAVEVGCDGPAISCGVRGNLVQAAREPKVLRTPE